MRFAIPPLVLGTALAVLAGGCSSISHSCTLLACNEGIEVKLSYRDAGRYVFEVTVDGTKTTCTATLPSTTNGTCDHPDLVSFYLVGSPAPPLSGLTIHAKTAQHVVIHATRDGALLADATFTPAYDVTTGPNGPDCDPSTCRLATQTFP